MFCFIRQMSQRYSRVQSNLRNDFDGGILSCLGVPCNSYTPFEGEIETEKNKIKQRIEPELPLPMVLPIFHRPILLGSSSFLLREGIHGESYSLMTAVRKERNSVNWRLTATLETLLFLKGKDKQRVIATQKPVTLTVSTFTSFS